MDNVDLQVLRQVVAWRAEGHAVVLGTITRTWGSAPRPVGAVVAVRGDGQIAESKEHAEMFKAVLEKAAKRFAALAKVEERHANNYQSVLDKLPA